MTELSESFRDIALANRRFGGIAFAPLCLAEPARADRPGRRDRQRRPFPASLQTHARERGGRWSSRPRFQRAGRRAGQRDRTDRTMPLPFVQADGTRLPFADAAFDVAMCNLTLHHLDPPEAVALLRELRRVSRVTAGRDRPAPERPDVVLGVCVQPAVHAQSPHAARRADVRASRLYERRSGRPRARGGLAKAAGRELRIHQDGLSDAATV